MSDYQEIPLAGTASGGHGHVPCRANIPLSSSARPLRCCRVIIIAGFTRYCRRAACAYAALTGCTCHAYSRGAAHKLYILCMQQKYDHRHKHSYRWLQVLSLPASQLCCAVDHQLVSGQHYVGPVQVKAIYTRHMFKKN